MNTLYIKEVSTMPSIQWYTLSPKILNRAYFIVQAILKDPFLTQTQIANLTRIPRPSVCRILNKLAEVGAIKKVLINVAGNRAYKYEVNPEFVDFLSKNLSTNDECSFSKGRGLSSSKAGQTDDTLQISKDSPENTRKPLSKKKNTRKAKSLTPIIQQVITKPDNPEELESWCKNGFFRIHGFQRKFTLRGYRFSRDDKKWEKLALILDGELIRRKIGRDSSGLCYIINVWNDTFKTHFSLQFRSNTLIVTLPKKESIYVPWDIFNEQIEQKIVEEIMTLVERTIKAYSEVFSQQVLVKDAGWVGRKRQLRPEVAFIDPDGIVRRIYEVEGATYIEGLGYWIDGSIKSTPELEFESIKESSNFKKAVDILASGELDEKLKNLDKKVSELDESIPALIAKGVELATHQLASSLIGGVRPVQDQMSEMWKRISEMQETLNLMLMYQVARTEGDRDLVEALKDRLIERVGLPKYGGGEFDRI